MIVQPRIVSLILFFFAFIIGPRVYAAEWYPGGIQLPLANLDATAAVKYVSQKAPFEVPTYRGRELEFRSPVPPLQSSSPKVDADYLYRMALDCYPTPSKFQNLKMDLKAGLHMNTDMSFDTFEVAKPYVGVVVSLPIYDGVELDREKEREYMRRLKVSSQVATFIRSVAERTRATRSLGIFLTLEQRSKIRVRKGIASATEQIDYLKEVIQWEEALELANAQIMESRLALEGNCRSSDQHVIHNYLMQFIEKNSAQIKKRQSS
jgi:hypothetical protein